MNLKNTVLLLALFLNVDSLLIAQETAGVPGFKLHSEISGLQIFSQDMECNDTHNGIYEHYMVFMFVNSTGESMNISWQKETWYNNICTTCGKTQVPENTFNITLQPGESIQGKCDASSNSGLKVFKEFTNSTKGRTLTKFEFKNLVINFN